MKMKLKEKIKPKNTKSGFNTLLNHPPPWGFAYAIFGLAYNLFYHKRNEYLRFSSEKTWDTWAINLQKDYETQLPCLQWSCHYHQLVDSAYEKYQYWQECQYFDKRMRRSYQNLSLHKSFSICLDSK